MSELPVFSVLNVLFFMFCLMAQSEQQSKSLVDSRTMQGGTDISSLAKARLKSTFQPLEACFQKSKNQPSPEEQNRIHFFCFPLTTRLAGSWFFS